MPQRQSLDHLAQWPGTIPDRRPDRFGQNPRQGMHYGFIRRYNTGQTKAHIVVLCVLGMDPKRRGEGPVFAPSELRPGRQISDVRGRRSDVRNLEKIVSHPPSLSALGACGSALRASTPHVRLRQGYDGTRWQGREGRYS